jgi:tol-pal system protein YbgF
MKLVVSTTLALFSIIFYGCALRQDIYSLDNRLVALEKRNIVLENQSLGQNQSNLELKKRILKLEKRILKLEKQNLASKKELTRIKSSTEDSNKTHKEKEQNLRNQSAKFHVILEGLREEIQLINGKLEETDYVLRQKVKVFEDVDKEKNSQLNQLGNMLNKLENSIDSNKDIIARLEQYLKFESSEKIDLTIKKDTEAEKEPSGKELYLLAKMAFDQGDFETAREEFGKFLTKYPKSERADNAQYWIGEIYYREKWYEKAILEYQKVIENYPKGNKVPDSLLKQGFAFINIGDKANARLVFKELIEKYPKSEQTKVAKEKLKKVGL